VVAGQDVLIPPAALLSEEVGRFFATYRDAFNNGDPAAVAEHIAAPCLLVEREMAVWSTADQVVEAMTRLLTVYRESGSARAHFLVEGLLPQGETDVVANVAWTIDRADGRESWNFRTGYNLRRIGGTWRIVCFTAF
jgi:ketosteroid isomerase-like protein